MYRLFALALGLSLTLPAQPIEDQVRAIFVQRCISCHGTAKMSGLDLSTREAILAGGIRGQAVVPGKASESLLYKAVARDGKLQMPPGKNALSPEQVRIVGEWIAAGAPFSKDMAEPAWWSFQRPTRAATDSINTLARPESPAADRRALIRRATFDLTGLPPTPEEVDAFLKDPDAKAYEKEVERLLASPHYGEKWGRMWLDVARYADTRGL